MNLRTVISINSIMLAAAAWLGLAYAADVQPRQKVKSPPAKNEASQPQSVIERVAAASRVGPGGATPLRPKGDAAIVDAEGAELLNIFNTAQQAYSGLSDLPADGAKRRAINLEMTRELEGFLQAHPDSAWAADVHLRLGLACQLRSSYSKAIAHYSAAWEQTKNSVEIPARQIAVESLPPLAKLLALTGRNDALAALQTEVRAAGRVPAGTD